MPTSLSRGGPSKIFDIVVDKAARPPLESVPDGYRVFTIRNQLNYIKSGTIWRIEDYAISVSTRQTRLGMTEMEVGQRVYSVSEGKEFRWDGTAWVDSHLLPDAIALIGDVEVRVAGPHQPFGGIDIVSATPILTGMDMREADLFLHIMLRDPNAAQKGHARPNFTISLDLLREQDDRNYVGVYDTGFVRLTMTDYATGSFTLTESGRNFVYVGSYLTKYTPAQADIAVTGQLVGSADTFLGLPPIPTDASQTVKYHAWLTALDGTNLRGLYVPNGVFDGWVLAVPVAEGSISGTVKTMRYQGPGFQYFEGDPIYEYDGDGNLQIWTADQDHVSATEYFEADQFTLKPAATYAVGTRGEISTAGSTTAKVWSGGELYSAYLVNSTADSVVRDFVPTDVTLYGNDHFTGKVRVALSTKPGSTYGLPYRVIEGIAALQDTDNADPADNPTIWEPLSSTIKWVPRGDNEKGILGVLNVIAEGNTLDLSGAWKMGDLLAVGVQGVAGTSAEIKFSATEGYSQSVSNGTVWFYHNGISWNMLPAGSGSSGVKSHPTVLIPSAAPTQDHKIDLSGNDNAHILSVVVQGGTNNAVLNLDTDTNWIGTDTQRSVDILVDPDNGLTINLSQSFQNFDGGAAAQDAFVTPAGQRTLLRAIVRKGLRPTLFEIGAQEPKIQHALGDRLTNEIARSGKPIYEHTLFRAVNPANGGTNFNDGSPFFADEFLGATGYIETATGVRYPLGWSSGAQRFNVYRANNTHVAIQNEGIVGVSYFLQIRYTKR